MAAARIMGDVCHRLIKPDNTNTMVTQALAKVAEAYDVRLVQGILMHQVRSLPFPALTRR